MTEPWWNDKDKAGGLAATIVILAIAVFILLLAIGLGGRIAIWLLS